MGEMVFALYKNKEKTGHPVIYRITTDSMLHCADVYIGDYYRQAIEKGTIKPEEAALRAYKIDFVE